MSVHAIALANGNTAISLFVRNLQGSVADDNTGGSAIQRIVGRRLCPLSCQPVSMPGLLGVDGSVGTVQYRPGLHFPLWDKGATASGHFDWTATFYEASPRIFGCDQFQVPSTGSLMPSYAINGYVTCARDGLGGAIVFSLITPGTLSASEVVIDNIEFRTLSGQVVGCAGPSGVPAGPNTQATCVSVPEPSSLLLLASGFMGLGWRRRREA